MRTILFFFAGITSFCSAQQWTQLPDFPGTPRDDAASFSVDGMIYVGTGMETGWGLTNDWYSFDQMTQQWDTIATLPASPRQYCSTFVIDGRGYLFGGLDASGPLNELWRYDPFTDTWTERASLPAPGRYASVALPGNNHAIITTGLLDNGVPTNETWKYDALSDSWSTRAPMPGQARHRSAVVNGAVVGGADSAYHALADAYSYISFNDQWMPATALPQPRFGARGADAILFCGASSIDSVHADVWANNWPDPSWNTTGITDFPGGPRRGGIVGLNTILADACEVFFGLGLDSASQRRKDWWRLVPDCPGSVSERITEKLLLSPNPGTNAMMISSDTHGKATVIIADPLGATVRSRTMLLPDVIDATTWSAGAYLVTVQDAKGKVYHARWIKQ